MQNLSQLIAPPARAAPEPYPTLDAISQEMWDVVVVGAGPAGAAAAALLAERGLRVLLLEKSRWPRVKACGGCLNHRSIGLLRQMELHGVLKQGIEIDRCILQTRGRKVTVPLPRGVAISRLALDSALVEAARSRGVIFAAGVSAVLLPQSSPEPFREISLHSDRGDRIVRTRVMLACDGINGTSLNRECWARWDVSNDAYVGVAATLPADEWGLSPNSIYMHLGRGGYVGGVRYPDGSTHLGAALSPAVCHQGGGPQSIIARILRECDAPLQVNAEQLKMIKWHGTPLLTRRRRSLGGDRVLAVGDACGYVEPFTGEGIAWALQSAWEATHVLPESVAHWPEDLAMRWQRRYRCAIRPQQRKCRAIRWILRQPGLSTGGVRLLQQFPSLARWAGGSTAHSTAASNLKRVPQVGVLADLCRTD